MPDMLRIGVLVAGAWAAAALALEMRGARAHGRAKRFSQSAGSPRAGILYAFGPGMLPGAKESVRTHRGTWFTGVAYHVGIFSSFAALVLLIGGRLPAGSPVLHAIQVLSGVGAAGGIILIVKRLSVEHLRAISHIDDYIANALTTLFAGLVLARTLRPAIEPWLLVEAALLLLYVPVGKIRHCVFFFPTRARMGAFFGRRGVFPVAHARAQRPMREQAQAHARAGERGGVRP